MARSRRQVASQQVPDRITIPNLDGAIVAGALRQAELVGFTLVIADPPMDVATLAMSGRWIVAAQEPPAGSTRFRGDTVVVTLRRDGGDGGGDREPRNPLPPRLAARAPLDDDRENPLERTPTPSGHTRRGRPEDASVLRFERRRTPRR